MSEVAERLERLEGELSRVLESQRTMKKELERSRQQVDTSKALERKLER